MPPNLKKVILSCSISIIIGLSSFWIYEYYTEQCEALRNKIEYYQMETIVQQQFLSSPTYELISSLLIHEYWEDDIYQSINREPLVIVSSSRSDDGIDMTVVGTSQSFLSWYNTVQQHLSYCDVHIISVETKGNSISFRCKVTSLMT